MASFAMAGGYQVLLLLLIGISIFDISEARRSGSSFRYRGGSGSYQSTDWDKTEAIVSVSVLLGWVIFIVVFILLRAYCCPHWSLKRSVSDCIDCKCCKKCKDRVIITPNVTLKEKPKNTKPPVKRHMSELRLEIQTPKQVLEKRDSKTLEKKLSLYESNPQHYRAFMEPPPAYEYTDPKETEKEQENQSKFLQNRQRIHRVVSELNSDHINKARTQSQAGNGNASSRTAQRSQDDVVPTSTGSRKLIRTESAPKLTREAY